MNFLNEEIGKKLIAKSGRRPAMHQVALRLVYSKPAKEEITTKEIVAFLKGKRITLDCGHHYTVHNLSNTMLLHADGTSECHS